MEEKLEKQRPGRSLRNDNSKLNNILKSSMGDEASAAVQLLRALSMIHISPDIVRLGDFVCESLKKLAQIDKCAVCLRGTKRVIGDSSEESERLMEKIRIVPEKQEHFSIVVPVNEKRKAFLIGTPDCTFGYLFLDVKDVAKLDHIDAVIQSFISAAASEMGRKRHQAEIAKLRNHLTQSGKDRESGISALNPGKERTDDMHKDEEAFFRVLYDHSPDMQVSVSIEDAKILMCNETLLKETGYNKDEVIGFPIFKMYHKDCMDDAKEVFNQFGETGEILDRELVLRKKDGRRMEVSLNSKAIKDKSGKILRSVSTMRDISARKRYESELASADYIINHSPVVAIQWKNEQGWPVKFASENIKDLLGYSATEIVSGKVSYMELIHPDDINRVESEVLQAINKAGSENFIHQPYRVLTKSSGIRWIEDRTTLVRGADGGISDYQGMVCDVTDQIELEEKIRSYQKLFEDSINEIYFFDMESHKFIEVNRAAIENLGFTEEELRGMSPYDIRADFSRKEYHRLVQDIKKENREGSTFTAIHRRKDGSTYPVEVHIQLARYRNSPVFVVFALDITHRVNAENALKIHRDQLEETIKMRTQEFKRQSKKLEESQLALTYLLEDMGIAREKMEETNIKLIDANEELESFSYSVSHDLRAPLRAIVGFSAKFQSQYGTGLDEEGRRLFSVISKNAVKMGRLIDDLLTFSRMSRTEIRKLNVHMKGVADEAWQDILEQTSVRNVRIEINDLPDVKGDRNMLKQVFVNIFGNALKFSKSGEPNVIEVGGHTENGSSIYYIKDNGVGFDMKYTEKLFQVFQRLHSEKEFEGTGVGLAIVKRIITKHEGKIWAESAVDKGAKFSFILPA